MRLIETQGTAEELRALIRDHARADYVYMYPPRQAYRPLPHGVMEPRVEASLRRQGPINLYLHFPFCRQICAFCNLYAVPSKADASYADYVEALTAELEHYAPRIRGRVVDTIYLGGGTPSLLQPELVQRLLNRIGSLGMATAASVPEVAMEVAPDTVDPGKLAGYRDAGITRVNLGIQAWNDTELRLIGRRHGVDAPLSALESAVSAGFPNVCVDLIYGLDGQTDSSWHRSLQEVISRQPQTVCAYPLTLRPHTGFAVRGLRRLANADMYRRYDVAHELLLLAGYRQETHVRWVLDDRGGYRQKANHWAGQDIVGIGAGARGYLWDVDYRNGYSVVQRQSTLREYLHHVSMVGHARMDGLCIDPDEQRRRHVILGLGNLDRDGFLRAHEVSVDGVFGEQIGALVEIGALADSVTTLSWTPLGQRHRDVLVQAFFSRRVRQLVGEHAYLE